MAQPQGWASPTFATLAAIAAVAALFTRLRPPMPLFPAIRRAILFIALAASNPWASAQYSPKTSLDTSPGSSPGSAGRTSCLSANALVAPQLYGRWAVRFSPAPPGWPATAVMRLERHAEFSDSLAGSVARPAPAMPAGTPSTVPTVPTAPARYPAQAALAGDVDGGFLLLDESADNIRITASWNGEMVPGSCGQAFTGEWKDLSEDVDNTSGFRFTLTRLP